MTITAPIYRAVSQTLVTSSTSVTPPLPAGWQPDDIVIVAIAQTNAATLNAFTTPTGWTLIGAQGTVGAGTSTNLRFSYYWRRMQSGDVAVSFSSGANSSKFATTIAFRNCHGAGSGQTISPLDVNADGNASSPATSWSISAGTTTYDNSMVVYELATEASSASPPGTNYPIISPANTTLVSLTDIYEVSFTSGSGIGRAQLYGVMATAGDTGSLTGTALSGYNCWGALALRGIDEGGGGGDAVSPGKRTLLGAGL